MTNRIESKSIQSTSLEVTDSYLSVSHSHRDNRSQRYVMRLASVEVIPFFHTISNIGQKLLKRRKILSQNEKNLFPWEASNILISDTNVYWCELKIEYCTFLIRAKIQSKFMTLNNDKNRKNWHFKRDLGYHNSLASNLIMI